MSDEVFRVMLRMQVIPGKAEEFEKVWYDSAGTITGQPANLGQWLSRADDEEDVYYIISDWVNEERFREYEQSEEHVVHRGNLHPYRSKGSMQTMRVVHNLTGAAARA
ncbi:MAG TPA: antibiotic biosynthesis monooxygenase family protein [Amycolatopsis sp.]|nr:antibiotic biosynthesis monooxygenase family protein [Amycolatopsis sp.]